MKLHLYRALWGVVKSTGGPHTVEGILPVIARMGYVGIEAPLKLAHEVWFSSMSIISLAAL